MAILRVVRAGAVRAARQLHAPAPRAARQLHAPAVALSPVEQRSKARAPGQAPSHENITLSKQDLGVVERQAQDPFNTYQPLSQVAGRCVFFVRVSWGHQLSVSMGLCVYVCMCVSHAYMYTCMSSRYIFFKTACGGTAASACCENGAQAARLRCSCCCGAHPVFSCGAHPADAF